MQLVWSDLQHNQASGGLGLIGLWSPQAKPATVNVTLDPAVIVFSAPAIAAVMGAIAPVLGAAVITTSAPSLVVVPGAITVILGAAVITTSAPSLVVVPGAITVILGAAVITTSAPSITVILGTLTVVSGAAVINCSAPNISVTLETIVVLDPAIISILLPGLDVTLGLLGITATRDFEVWGGLLLISSGTAGDIQRAEVVSRGFLILGEENLAGLTRLSVAGRYPQVIGMQETEVKLRIPSYFFGIRAGERLDLTRARQWTSIPNTF